MSEKAKYYPKLTITKSFTRFGSEITDNPTLYEKPINGRIIVRVDLLQSLEEKFGPSMIQCRDDLFHLVSGDLPDQEYRRLLMAYYSRVSSFTNFVNEQYYFGNSDKSLIARIIEPLRACINNYVEVINKGMYRAKPTFLMRSHEYVYFCVENPEEINVRGEVKTIC